MSNDTTTPQEPTAYPTGPLVEALAALIKQGAMPARQIAALIDQDTQAPCLLWPDKTLTDLEHLLKTPEAKRGHAELSDVDSFIAYIKRHRTAGTIVLGDFTERDGWFRSILDHHTPHQVINVDEGDTVEERYAAGWSEHTARICLQTTPEWRRWTDKAGKQLTQQEFAEFIEDNAPDVVAPDAPGLHGVPPGTKLPSSADLLQVALTLQVNTDVRFNSAIKLSNGSTQLAFAEQVNGSYGAETKLTVPDLFTIGIAPFIGAPKFVVQIRLRYRASGGKATFSYQIVRPHKVVAVAWEEQRSRIEEQTGLQVLRGEVASQKREATKR